MAEQVTCTCNAKIAESELLEKLDDVLEEYRLKPGALIPVLQITQNMFGYLP